MTNQFAAELFPWQKRQWKLLQVAVKQQKLAHAWLLSGLSGLGKLDFANKMVAAYLCLEQKSCGNACGQCRSCHLYIANTHPDYILMQPHGDSSQIKIEQIRDLSNLLSKTGQITKRRAVIIEPAEAMNVAAVNALLKFLEEPPAAVLIVLISSNYKILLPTVRSRCQLLNFYPSWEQSTLNWLNQESCVVEPKLLLNITGGVPLQAKILANSDSIQWQQRLHLFTDLLSLLAQRLDPICLAEKYVEFSLLSIIDYFLAWIRDIVSYKYTKLKELCLNFDLIESLIKLSEQENILSLMQLFDFLISIRRLLIEKANINLQLVLESIFIQWSTLASRG